VWDDRHVRGLVRAAGDEQHERGAHGYSYHGTLREEGLARWGQR
jgi:hypothetical protein